MVFESIENVEFDEQKITTMISGEKERVPLLNPIDLALNFQMWNELEKGMIETLFHLINKGIQEFEQIDPVQGTNDFFMSHI